jgi:hypothetical protein
MKLCNGSRMENVNSGSSLRVSVNDYNQGGAECDARLASGEDDHGG